MNKSNQKNKKLSIWELPIYLLLEIPAISIICGFVLVAMGVNDIFSGEQQASGYSFNRLIHTLFGDSIGTLIAGAALTGMGCFLMFNGLKKVIANR